VIAENGALLYSPKDRRETASPKHRRSIVMALRTVALTPLALPRDVASAESPKHTVLEEIHSLGWTSVDLQQVLMVLRPSE